MATYTDPVQTGQAQPVLTVRPSGQSSPATRFVFLAGVLAVAASLIFVGENYYLKSRLKSVNQEISQRRNQVQSFQPMIAELNHDSQISKGLHALINNQREWKGVLSLLQQHLYKKMLVTSIQITDQGVVNLAGTTPSFADYAKVYSSFIDAEAKTFFTGVRPISVTATDKATGVNFSFSFTLLPSMLNPAARPAHP